MKELPQGLPINLDELTNCYWIGERNKFVAILCSFSPTAPCKFDSIIHVLDEAFSLGTVKPVTQALRPPLQPFPFT